MRKPFKKSKKAKAKVFNPRQAGRSGKLRQWAGKLRVKRHQKQKAAEETKIRRHRLRGAGKRKILRWVAIVAFIFMAMGVINSYRHNGMIFDLQNRVSALDSHGKQNKAQQHPATGPGAEHFAKQFMEVYTNVGPGEDAQNERKDELDQYLAAGLDENAGTDYSSLDGERVYQDSTVLAVKPAGKQTADVYMQVKYDYKYQEEKTVKKKKKKKKELVDKTKQDLTDNKVLRLYADQDGYAVVELPRPFVSDNHTKVAVDDDKEGQEVNNEVAREVGDFLEDFFKAYTSDDSDDLKYYFVDASDAKSIKSEDGFDGIGSTQVYNGEKKGRYEVDTEIILKDPETGIVSHVPYQMHLRKSQDKYQIEDLSSRHHNIH